jgi:hypothetical protein
MWRLIAQHELIIGEIRSFGPATGKVILQGLEKSEMDC